MTCRVSAVSLDDYDYDEIDDSISEYDVEFEDIASLVMCGKYSDALRMAGTAAVYGIFGGFVRQKEIFIKLFLLSIYPILLYNISILLSLNYHYYLLQKYYKAQNNKTFFKF